MAGKCPNVRPLIYALSFDEVASKTLGDNNGNMT